MEPVPGFLLLLQPFAQTMTVPTSDKAEAVKAYARKARLGREIFVEASIVKARAERRLGEMLRETPLAKATPGNQYTGALGSKDADGAYTLESLGLTKSDSSRLQRVASLPPETFEEHVAQNLAANREVTTAGLLRLLAAHNKPKVAKENSGADPARRPSDPIADRVDSRGRAIRYRVRRPAVGQCAAVGRGWLRPHDRRGDLQRASRPTHSGPGPPAHVGPQFVPACCPRCHGRMGVRAEVLHCLYRSSTRRGRLLAGRNRVAAAGRPGRTSVR